MDSILSDIENIKTEISEYIIIEPGNIFTTHEETRTHIKLKWLKLCMFEESIHKIANKIRILPNVASTNIASPAHPEFIQILNTLLAILSPQVFTRDSIKLLEEYMESYENMKENPDILNSLQSFKMSKIRFFLLSNLTSLQEHLLQHRKDIEIWTKRSRTTSNVSNMHS